MACFLYKWQTLIAGALAIVAAVITAGAAYWVGNIQVAALRQKDRLQARGIVVGVYPELLELQIIHERAAKAMEDWPSLKTRTTNTTTVLPGILRAKIPLTPMMTRNVDNFFVVQPGAASLIQVVAFTLQYNNLIETLAQQINDNINDFDPPTHQAVLAGNLTAIRIALDDAICEIAPIHDEATVQ